MRTLLKFLFIVLPALLGVSLVAGALPSSARDVIPLATGQAAPGFEVIAPDGTTVNQASILAGRPTVLIFYRGGWCPFCNRHLAALAESEIELRKLGFQIIGVTADKPEALASTANETKARYRLFSDRTMQAAGAFGVAFRLDRETGERFRKNGIDVPAAPDGDGYWQPVPAAFILSADGIIRFVYHNADPAEAIGAERLLAVAKEIADKSGR